MFGDTEEVEAGSFGEKITGFFAKKARIKALTREGGGREMVGTQGAGGFGNGALVADLGEVVAGGRIYVNYIGYECRNCRW